MGPWRRVVTSWVNVLQLLPSDVNDFKDVLGSKFFHNFLREICGEEDNVDLSTPQSLTIVQYLKRKYPQFEVDGKALEYDETELVLVLSVLLFHSVLNGSDVTRVKMCCLFDEETQVVLKIFMEKLIPSSSEVLTKGDIVWAIQEAENGGSKGESMTCFSTTPKPTKTLQIFMQSPMTQQQKVINEKCQELQKLKMKLISEKSEKNYLLEELAQADDKLKLMTEKYEKTLKEVNKLKSEMLQEAEEQQDLALQGPDVVKEQKYSSVIGKLKNRVEELEEGTCVLNLQNDELRKQVKDQSEKIVNLKSKLEEYFRECDRLEEELAVKTEQLNMVTERCQDLEKFFKETKASGANPRHNMSVQSFTGEVEDLGSSVTDLKLCEEKEKNRALTEKVEELMLSLDNLESVKAQNSALQEQLRSTMEQNETFTNKLQTSCHKIQLLENRIAELEEESTSLQQLNFEIKGTQETGNKLRQANAKLEAETKLLTEQILKQKESMEKLINEKNEQDIHYKQITRMTSRMAEVKSALEKQLQECQQQMETLKIENKVEAELVKEMSSRNEALQAQNASLEEALLQEQKCINEKNDKLKEFSSTIEELTGQKEKLQERFRTDYSNLRKQLELRYTQLNEARTTFRSLHEKMEAEVLRRVEAIKGDYKDKMHSLEITMKEAYNAEVAKRKVSGESEAQLKAFVEELKAKYRQLAIEKQEVQEELLRVKVRSKCHDVVSDMAPTTGSGDVLDETIAYMSWRRKSVQTSGTGHMIHEEDEQGEKFNNTFLVNMKAGVCLPEDRLGELRYRNSLCPPHLKSSYPAETQFHDPRLVTDEDIMMGLSDDQARRKDRGYRKPPGMSVVGEDAAQSPRGGQPRVGTRQDAFRTWTIVPT